jgi:crotonobetainyl-CoA:carnitine CoA-transferase CaiB-like acyl-CoA transferase
MQALLGVRVLDLSRVLAGPFCTMSLGDLGAEVIKVEEPGTGDETRGFGPPFVQGISTYFLSINRNKKSFAVNLKHPEGLKLVQALAVRSDVVVENFRPGVAERLGVGWDRLRSDNPRLIYCSISGFGHQGLPEYTKLPGYDAVMQGLAGLQHLTGQADGPPTKVGISIADILTGMTAMQGILLALFSRERTGRGSRLDISMLDSTLQALTFQAASHLIANRNPGRVGNRHASIAPYETFRAKDGYLNVAVANDAQFKKLCDLLGTPALAEDPRFAQNRSRVENRDALAARLGEVFQARPVEEWMSALQSAGITAGPIFDLSQLFAHPQLVARQTLVGADHPLLGAIRMVGSPIKTLPLEGPPTVLPPPALGEHTEEILTSALGLNREEVQRLATVGAVALKSA